MKNSKWVLAMMFVAIFFAGCSNTPTTSDPKTPDPLQGFYNNWLSECADFGGGNINQIFANLASDGSLNLAVLTWTNPGCTGPYSLSDFDGNPLTAPAKLNTFISEDITGIPATFFIFKITSTKDSGVTYGVFHLLDDKFYVLSDFTTNHDNWTDWLAETDVQGFVDDSAGYVPTTHSKTLYNLSDLPNPMASLNGNWLSDCVDFGGGPRNQIYAEFSTGAPKSATLTWDTDNCTGSYTLTDSDGNTVMQAAQTQTVVNQAVLGIPRGVFIPTVTDIQSSDVIYPIIDQTSDTEFYELVPFTTTHDNWNDWLLETDVSGFVGDPVGFSPASHIKFHFTSVPGLP